MVFDFSITIEVVCREVKFVASRRRVTLCNDRWSPLASSNNQVMMSFWEGPRDQAYGTGAIGVSREQKPYRFARPIFPILCLFSKAFGYNRLNKVSCAFDVNMTFSQEPANNTVRATYQIDQNMIENRRLRLQKCREEVYYDCSLHDVFRECPRNLEILRVSA
jgi:hypothetical protein